MTAQFIVFRVEWCGLIDLRKNTTLVANDTHELEPNDGASAKTNTI